MGGVASQTVNISSMSLTASLGDRNIDSKMYFYHSNMVPQTQLGNYDLLNTSPVEWTRVVDSTGWTISTCKNFKKRSIHILTDSLTLPATLARSAIWEITEQCTMTRFAAFITRNFGVKFCCFNYMPTSAGTVPGKGTFIQVRIVQGL